MKLEMGIEPNNEGSGCVRFGHCCSSGSVRFPSLNEVEQPGMYLTTIDCTRTMIAIRTVYYGFFSQYCMHIYTTVCLRKNAPKFRQTRSSVHNIWLRQSAYFKMVSLSVHFYLYNLPLKCSDANDTIYYFVYNGSVHGVHHVRLSFR